MKLTSPFPLSKIGQKFGQNAVDIYANSGWKGHTAVDFEIPWGTQLPAFADGIVYSVINKENPDPMRYRAVFQLVQDGNNWYEVSYGHMNDIYVLPGQYVKTGTILGTTGNTGDVWSGNRYIIKEEKLAGSKAGAHLHGPQVRPVWRKKNIEGITLNTGYGVYRDAEGYCFQVKDPNNFYAGCVDPMPFLTNQPTELSPSDKVAVLAAQKLAMGDTKTANMLQAIVQLLKAWGY